MTDKSDMNCDICGKKFKTLGNYGDGDKWWICLKCFDKADTRAFRDDRWPDARDFEYLRDQCSTKT